MSIIRTDQDAANETPADSTGQTLILIHGRNALLSAPQLLGQWRTALEHGLERDYPAGPDLSRVRVQLVYYGDLLDAEHEGTPGSATVELADRENALKLLMARKSSKKFRRVHYEALPGHNRLKEFLADVSAPVSAVLGLGEKRIQRMLPELISYWNNENELRDESQRRLRRLLGDAFERDDRVLVIAHCIGSVVAYDTLWSMTHDDAQPARSDAEEQKRLDTFVTLGSPLADDYVRHRLAGGRSDQSSGKQVSYPDIVNNWLNVAAEDDYVCHDETVENDFRAMLESHLISRIKDYRIYNLAERFGQADPHDPLGYLIHPRMSRILNDWLTKGDGT